MSTQRYTPEFKEEAVRQVVDRGYSVAEVSSRLGVSSHSLYQWVKAVTPYKTEKQVAELIEAKSVGARSANTGIMRTAMRLSILILIVLSSFGIRDRRAAADPGPMTPPEPLRQLELVLIKGGCYEMGDTFGDGDQNERPVHEVCVKDFYIGKYPVTQMQWTGTMGSNPSRAPTCGMTCPVENVSWNEVQEFIGKLNQRTGKAYRLPTEAEWEYAARGGTKDDKWAGSHNEKELGDYAWYYNNSTMRSHPVGLKKPNAIGLYDMTGNVWEWMSDWYDESYYAKSPKDGPQGAATGLARSLRGGYWGDLSHFARVTRRIGLAPSARGGGYGFRVALSAP